MTDQVKTPRELLENIELIGFARLGRGEQIVRRASSAKVTEFPTAGDYLDQRKRPADKPAS
jgi:hypothetical protein